ncbi:hypothetical protein [Yoonia sp.]|uniref:hypothetical protein n=1 Tax=Yoonia sp. TaxID=2212373 RepID=UPI002E03F7C2|nr:hypothetical protein [Yoonia sp.]
MSQNDMTQLFMIRRTYNRFGDYDTLCRMDGNCPMWTGAAQFGFLMYRAQAEVTLEVIGTYRDHLCPDGIKGLEIVPAPVRELKPG